MHLRRRYGAEPPEVGRREIDSNSMGTKKSFSGQESSQSTSPCGQCRTAHKVVSE